MGSFSLRFFKQDDMMWRDKLKDIITNLGSAFSSVKNTSNTPPTKVAKFIYVPKNKGESSSKKNEDLKSISVHPNFFDIIK